MVDEQETKEPAQDSSEPEREEAPETADDVGEGAPSLDLTAINERISALEGGVQEILSMVSALAEQGALDNAVNADNEVTGEDEYPTLDLEKMMGD